jgi:phage shock protein A
MKRKKRLEKGIESLKKQVEIHKEKLKQAIEEGNEELARYYIKDLARLENEEKKKEEFLEK